MNEFIEQFLIECRELVEQATGDLLALEERPGDRERLDSVFRAFHTLKGSAGIVEFPAMARALHAAEDALTTVRGGGGTVGPGLAGDCLACLDQVVQWLDHMEAHSEPPPDAEAQASADALLRRFEPHGAAGRPAASAPAAPEDADWLDDLLALRPAEAAQAATAIRYAPDADCFFRDEDPLARLAGLPGLLAVEMAPVGEWPPLDALDPYVCSVRLSALLSSSPEELARPLEALRGQVDVRALSTPAGAPGSAQALPPLARGLLQAQLLMLAETATDGAPGRIASAARVAVNVLRRCGMAAEAAPIENAAAAARAQADPRVLSTAIERCLRGEAPAEPAPDQPDALAQIAEAAVRTLRVDAERVDELVRLTGEFTVATNALGHAAALAREETAAGALASLLRDQHARLERLLGELQRSVLELRVLPLRHVFQRFPRLAREVAASLGKPVRLVVEGDETEADKAVVEGLPEPMLHLVRNAIDHGVESPADRAAAGKPPVATVRLRASRQGEHVVVEVQDDGRGVDPASVRRAAAARGVVPADEIAAMSDEDVLGMIFAPGLSTAATTTALSGRGVGMDAVLTAVERLGGRVGVESRPGQGTTIRLTLPFSVMLTRVMTVEAGGQVFGIPLDAVIETVRVPRSQITAVGAAHAFVLRDRTVPLVDLAQALGEREGPAAGAEANVVVASTGGGLTGLEVERLGERMDVMLKPVEGLLAGMRGIAGTTLLGDGRVLIVVDVEDLFA